MILSRSKSYIFIHIPKTGGSAWSKLLGADITWQDLIVGATPIGEVFNAAWAPRFGIHKHISAAQLEAKIGIEEMRKYFIFSVVRNPVNRFLSSFNFLRTLSQKQAEWALGLLKKHNVGAIATIDDMLSSSLWNGCRELQLNQADEFQKFLMPQHLFLDTTEKGELKVEMFKLEEFDKTKASLVARHILSTDSVLPRTNESVRFVSRTDLSEEQVKEIAVRYAKDFEVLGY